MTAPAGQSAWSAARTSTLAQEAMLAGLAVLVVHAVARIWVAPGAYQDDAIYLALGKALASGRGWHSVYAVGSPVHLKYPPALPGIYALLWMAGGSIERTLGFVHAFHLLVSGACGALAWWIVRARLGGSAAAAMTALVPFGLVSVVDHWQLSITEGPYVATWLGVLVLALAPLTRRRAHGLGLLLAVATLLRAQGWALIGGVVIALCLTTEGRRHVLITGGAAIAPVLAWSAMVALLARHGAVSTQPDEAGYLAPLIRMPFVTAAHTLASSVSLNIAEYWRIIPRELGPAGPGHLLAVVCFMLGLVGASRDARRIAPLSLTLAMSLVMLLVLPYNQERYVLGVAPVCALLVVHGWAVIASRFDARTGMALATGSVAMVLFHQRAIRRAATSPDPIAEVGFEPVGHVLTRNTAWLETVVPWVMTHTPANARVFTEGAAGLWLATGRTGVAALPAGPTFIVRPPDDPEGLAARLIGDSITVVIASSAFVNASVAALNRRCPGTFPRSDTIGALATALAVSDRTRECLRRVISGGPAP